MQIIILGGKINWLNVLDKVGHFELLLILVTLIK